MNALPLNGARHGLAGTRRILFQTCHSIDSEPDGLISADARLVAGHPALSTAQIGRARTLVHRS
ncbi:MAG: hypothetical protein OXG37_03470 [Actinomycetia bacterium]|nr:hypothetical protein [Actinomycetes bacterium]